MMISKKTAESCSPRNYLHSTIFLHINCYYRLSINFFSYFQFFLPQISFSTNLSWFDDVREGAVGLLDSGGQLDLKASQLQSLLTDGPQAGPCS